MVCIGKNIANCSKNPQFLPIMSALCPRCARAVHTRPQDSFNRRRLPLDQRRHSAGWPLTNCSYSPAGALRRFECTGCWQLHNPGAAFSPTPIGFADSNSVWQRMRVR